MDLAHLLFSPIYCLAALALGATVFYAWGLKKGFYEQKQLLKIVPQPLSGPLWICIPVRNERQRLPKTLQQLCKNEQPELQIYVVDDGSTDGTREWVENIMKSDPRLHFMANESENAGKPGALAWLITHLEATDEPLPDAYVFLDADMHVHPDFWGGLQALMAQGPYAALSGAPYLECKTLSEQLLVPAVAALAAGLYPPSQVHQGSKAFLNGQLIYIQREKLREVGGWNSVAQHTLEDVALAHRLNAGGFSLGLMDLRDHVQTRMYTRLSEILAGFSKNIFPLVGGPLPAIGLSLVGIVLTWAPTAFLVASVIQKAPLYLPIACWLLAHSCQGLIRRLWKQPFWPAFLSPITALGIVVIVGKSLYHLITKKPISWRGRSVSLQK